jgi:hypothetical protein
MKSWKRIALFATVLAGLGTLGAVGAATLGSEEAAAVPCCNAGCDYGYDRCVNRCGEDWDCVDRCWDRFVPCYSNCELSC